MRFVYLYSLNRTLKKFFNFYQPFFFIVLVFIDKAGILIRNIWDFDYVVVTCCELIGLECVD